MASFPDILLAATMIVFLPVRGWYRYRRNAAPSPAPIYLAETALLTAILIWLLHRHGVQPQAIGIRPVFTIAFIINLIACVAVVTGLDVVSLRIVARQVAKRQRTIQLATYQTSGLVTDTLQASRRLSSFIPVVIMGAVWEELCFRGTFFLFVPRMPIVLFAGGIVAGALSFGSQHLRNGPVAATYSTFYGLLFSCLYLVTGDLTAVVVSHAAGNLFAATYAAPRIARVRQEAVHKASIFVG
jgi:membrane protease YdiL (CAAX protease family)